MVCGDNLVEYFRGQPLRLQIDFATRDLFRDQCDDGTKLALANFCNFFESPALFEKSERFLRRAGMAGSRIEACPLAVPKALQGGKDLLSVHLCLFLTEAGDTAQFGEAGWPRGTELVEGRVMHDDECGNSFLPGNVPAPLAHIFS